MPMPRPITEESVRKVFEIYECNNRFKPDPLKVLKILGHSPPKRYRFFDFASLYADICAEEFG
jgi:hypothetical protein